MRWARPARVCFVPKATVSDLGATCRDGSSGDIPPSLARHELVTELGIEACYRLD
jgi:hypothetical protein